MGALTERFEMRLDEEMLERVDDWRENKDGGLSRSEAIRRLIGIGLQLDSPETAYFSDGEKILLLMMRDVYRHLGVRDAECDADFIAEVIFGGHYWAPSWRLPGVFHGHRDDPRDVRFVVEVLDMWTFLERGAKGLSASDRKRVTEEAEVLGDVHFRGFDGNYEAELIGIAHFLIERLGRFGSYEGRELNSHMPTRSAYRRMLAVFEAMRPRLIGTELNADQIIQILNAWRASR